MRNQIIISLKNGRSRYPAKISCYILKHEVLEILVNTIQIVWHLKTTEIRDFSAVVVYFLVWNSLAFALRKAGGPVNNILKECTEIYILNKATLSRPMWATISDSLNIFLTANGSRSSIFILDSWIS